jgi:uncharacterized protein (UPF0548 family)
MPRIKRAKNFEAGTLNRSTVERLERFELSVSAGTSGTIHVFQHFERSARFER